MKPGLVLLPGLLCDGALWAPQVAALSDIAECWIPDSLAQASMPAMAHAVLRDAPFDRFALAGLSMGGYVCMEIMRQAPQRVGAIALLDTRATADTPEETQRRHDLMRLAQTARGFQPVTTRMLPLLIHESRLGDTPLEQIAVPSLVLCGRQDALTTLSDHEDMARLIPGAELIVVEQCGHLSSLERPDEVNSALRHWIAQL
jgi:pimeloyl-ACP methyl ester carboxylesterase